MLTTTSPQTMAYKTGNQLMSKRYRPNAGLILFMRQPTGPPRVRRSPLRGRHIPGKCHKAESTKAKQPNRLRCGNWARKQASVLTPCDLWAKTSDWIAYDFPEEVKAKFFKSKYDGQIQKWFAIELLPEFGEAAINIETAEPEFCDWKWVNFADTIDLIVPFKRDLYRRVYDELGGLVG